MILAAEHNKYNEIMGKITLTDDMRRRVLQNLAAADYGQTRKPEKHIYFAFTRWKESAALAACVTLLFVGVLAVPSLLGRQGAQLQSQPNSAQNQMQSGGQPQLSASSDGETEPTSSNKTSSSSASLIWSATPDATSGHSGGDDVILGASPSENAVLGKGAVKYASRSELAAAVGFEVEGIKRLPFAASSAEYLAEDQGSAAQITYTSVTGQTARWRKAMGVKNISDEAGSETLTFTYQGKKVTLLGADGSYSRAWWTDGAYTWSLTLPGGLSRSGWETLLAYTYG